MAAKQRRVRVPSNRPAGWIKDRLRSDNVGPFEWEWTRWVKKSQVNASVWLWRHRWECAQETIASTVLVLAGDCQSVSVSPRTGSKVCKTGLQGAVHISVLQAEIKWRCWAAKWSFKGLPFSSTIQWHCPSHWAHANDCQTRHSLVPGEHFHTPKANKTPKWQTDWQTNSIQLN